MDKTYEIFYHLQIAKCGGTFLNNTIVKPIFEILKENNIKYIDGEFHLGWQEYNNIYTISSLRDPAKRTVSHYAYTNPKLQKNDHGVSNFIKWVKDNENFISNYQIKNFLYTMNPLTKNHNIFVPNLNKHFMLIQPNKNLAENKIKRINILLKDTHLNYKNCELVGNIILKDFKINKKISIDQNKKWDHNINETSKIIYSLLTKKEIDYLYYINAMDSEIYFSESTYSRFNEKIKGYENE